MKQHNQIGKYTKKEEYLDAKDGKTFVAPSGREYVFNYRKDKNFYTFIIGYMDCKMQIKESDFNDIHIDELLNIIERDSKII